MLFGVSTTTLIQGLIFSLSVGVVMSVVLLFLYRHIKNHPVSGKVIGKTIKKTLFVLIVEDAKGRRTDIITDEETWKRTQYEEQYTAQKTDWYLMDTYR